MRRSPGARPLLRAGAAGWLLAAGLSGLLLAGCAGDGEGNPVTGPGGEEGPTRIIKVRPSFANDIQEIFNRNGCTSSGCHGTTRAAELDLRAGNAYAHLVDVPARAEDFLRVVPGNPVDSYLSMKVEGRHSVGSRMPLNRQPLDTIDLTNIRNWITEGALNN